MGRHTEKLTVEDYVTVGTSDPLRYGFLPQCDYGLMTWRNAFGEAVYTLTLAVLAGVVNFWPSRQSVVLESMLLHFGGCRWWIKYPQCLRRCAKLHLLGGYFACRVCHNLVYQSQRLHRSFGQLTKVISNKKGREFSQIEIERACTQIRREQRRKFVRKRDRRPDYKSHVERRQVLQGSR